jgi:hypothetical protein
LNDLFAIQSDFRETSAPFYAVISAAEKLAIERNRPAISLPDLYARQQSVFL